MTITEFRECVEYNIEHNIKHAILGLGAPGVGKSQIIRQIGKKYGYIAVEKAEGGEKDAPRSNKNRLRPSARAPYPCCSLRPRIKRKRRHAALPLSPGQPV